MPFTPYDAASHAIGRARALLNASHPTSKIRSANTRTDLRRLSVVMAVSALDTYMHRLVVHRAFAHGALPAPLARLEVPFEQLLTQADETGEAARADPWNPRPRVGVKRQLRERLLRETFQRFEDVSLALSMAGCSKSWDAIGAEMDPALKPKQIRIRLNAIVRRRNQIVHEGDYERLERPQGSRRNPMPPREARRAVNFLSDLIDAIHQIA